MNPHVVCLFADWSVELGPMVGCLSVIFSKRAEGALLCMLLSEHLFDVKLSYDPLCPPIVGWLVVPSVCWFVCWSVGRIPKKGGKLHLNVCSYRRTCLVKYLQLTNQPLNTKLRSPRFKSFTNAKAISWKSKGVPMIGSSDPWWYQAVPWWYHYTKRLPHNTKRYPDDIKRYPDTTVVPSGSLMISSGTLILLWYQAIPWYYYGTKRFPDDIKRFPDTIMVPSDTLILIWYQAVPWYYYCTKWFPDNIKRYPNTTMVPSGSLMTSSGTLILIWYQAVPW